MSNIHDNRGTWPSIPERRPGLVPWAWSALYPKRSGDVLGELHASEIKLVNKYITRAALQSCTIVVEVISKINQKKSSSDRHS
jgi:hypothetical protein